MNRFHQWNKQISGIVSAKGEAITIGRTRLHILRTFCLVLFALVIVRVGDLSILQAPREPSHDYDISSAHIPTERADIIDRNGVLLATSLRVPSLYADPALVDNKAYVGNELDRILNLENTVDKLNRKGRFVWIKRGITPDQYHAINMLGSPGLNFRDETRRFYPQGPSTVHAVGYTSIDGKGLAGIERHYNARLEKGGEPLQLAMDVRVQFALGQSLKSHMDKFKAKAAIGGVVDVETGEIIAAVSLPDFDPHHIGKASQDEKFNRFSLGVYEMGSTFKLFSTAGYIESTGHGFQQIFDAREPLKEGRFTINDFHAEKRILTMPEVFIHSSNIGSALMGRAMGSDMMKDLYTKLGLMDRLDIDYSEVGKPLTPNPWRDTNTLTAAYGHGIAVSPLHVLKATAAIVNGGIAPTLSFAKKDFLNNDIQTRIISASTSYKMRQLLRLNVTNGSGKRANIEGYNVGGKTGTSEKSMAGGYDKDKLLSSFVGVFPSDNPKYAILAILDEPQGIKEYAGNATGGLTGAPIVGDVIADMTRIMGIAPSFNHVDMTAGLDRYLQKQDDLYSPASYSAR